MRYLLLSDIHGNLQAFEAILQDAPAGLPIWCLGDLVGYGPHPNECIELLKCYQHECIVGNHDWAVMGKVDVEDFNPDAKHTVEWTRDFPESPSDIHSIAGSAGSRSASSSSRFSPACWRPVKNRQTVC